MMLTQIRLTLRGQRGPADLSDFANVVSSLRTCLKHICRCVANTEDIEFDITDLRYSSAEVATSPVSNGVPESILLDVSDTFERSVSALEAGEPLDSRVDYAALRAFSGFSAVVKRRESHLTIGKTRLTLSYVGNLALLLEPQTASLGSVTGRLEAFDLHRHSEFTLYPPIEGEEVRCIFQREQLSRVLKAVERTVTVYGKLYYAATKSFPVRVEVEDFEIHPVSSDLPNLLNACGASRCSTPSVDAVREMRDEW